MISESLLFERYCEYPNKPATLEEIAELEMSLNVLLPSDYKRFLTTWNGGEFDNLTLRTPWCPEPGDQLQCLYGIGGGVDGDWLLGEDITLFDDNWPLKVLPIGFTLLGHLLLMDFFEEGYGSILIKKAFEDSSFVLLCPTITSLLEMLRNENNETKTGAGPYNETD